MSHPRTRLFAVVGVTASIMLIAPAKAQPTQAPIGPPQTPGPTIPEQVRPPAGSSGSAGDGVIPTPKGIDPAIQVPMPAPPQSSMPVIRPPEPSGRPQNAQPK